MTDVTTEMPRSRSIFIQSERVLRRSPLALTWPARLMAPPNSSSFSVSVVLPASGGEMIAKVRRRATSSDSAERDDDSVVAVMSDMNRAFGRENRRNQGRIGNCRGRMHAPYPQREDDLPITVIRGDDPALSGGFVMAWAVLFTAGLLEV